MAKSESRSKGGKGKPSGGGSGSAPSSPTRRLKKGGKRGRRLCHMDGCTLCPSFGFEGDVAVSCSHHKEEGMRNLTARRCQHEGCFTVANFGMPGDKPGYCAAHSTDGMVNRNKPRGAEGMLAGVTIARSSRRAAKANTALLEAAAEANRAAGTPSSRSAPLAIAAAATAAGAACAARNRASSGGKDLLLRAVAAAARDGGRGVDVDGELLLGKGFGSMAAAPSARASAASAVVGTRARTSGRLRVPRGENSDSEEMPDFNGRGGGGGAAAAATGGRGIGEGSSCGGVLRRANHAGGKVGNKIGNQLVGGGGCGINAEERRDPSMPASFVTFVARGEDLDPVPVGPPSSFSSSSSSCSSSSSSSSASSGRRVDAAKGVSGGAGRVRPRGGFGAAAMTVTAGVLHRQEAGFPGYRGGDAFQRRCTDGMSLGMGVGVGVGGRGGRGMGMEMELSFPGEARGAVMMDGPYPMEASCLVNSGVDTQLGFELGVGLEDMLVSEASDPTEGGLEEMGSSIGQADVVGAARAQQPASFSDRESRVGVVTPSAVRTQHDALRAAGGCLGLAGGVDGVGSSAGGVIEGDMVCGGEEGLSVGGAGVDFELDHLPELNTVDLTGLRAVESDCGGGGGGGCGVGVGGILSMPREPRPLSFRPLAPVTVPGPLAAGVCPPDLRLDGGQEVMTRLPSTSDFSSSAVAAADAALSSGLAPPSRSTATSTSAAGVAFSATSRSTNACVPTTDALVPAKLPCEEAWWDVLEGEGEDFVAMPEPVWGAALDGHGVDEEDDLRVTCEQRGGWRTGGGGANGGGGCIAGDATGVAATIGGDGLGLGNMSNMSRDRDASDGMVAAHMAISSRSLLSSSPGIGGVLTLAGDAGFPGGDISRGGDRGDGGSDGLALSGGACRRVEESAGDGGCGNGNGIGVVVCGGGGGGRLSPAKKRHRLAGREVETFQSPFIFGAAHHLAKRELGTTAMFPSSSSLSSSSSSSYSSSSSCSSSSYSSCSSSSASFALSSGIYSAAPVSFGLTVSSNVPGPSASLPHGSGVGLRSGASLQGGHMGKTMGKAWVSGDGWMPGDALSPSKCLALSPTKIVSASPSSSARPLLAPSTSTWGPGPLCSPQQTQAAGRA